MVRSRRVGTLTLGGCLVIFGILLFANNVITDIPYKFLLGLWPLILVSLGLEIILSHMLNKEEKMKYDFAAFFLVIVLTVFTLGMGFFDFVIRHAGENIKITM